MKKAAEQFHMAPGILIALLLVIAPLSLLLSLAIGSVDTSLSSLLPSSADAVDRMQQDIIFRIRWPRAASAFAAGGLLALAGTLMQALLRNPLADPYVLGISGGAATAALLAMTAGLGSAWLSGSAFAGALLSMLLVFGLAHGRGSWTPTRLLLTGVVIAFAWGAFISFLLAVSPDRQLRGMLFWLMGDLSNARSPWNALWVLAAGLLACLWLARSLNVLLRGPLQAEALGVTTRPLQLQIYVLTSLLTAVAVTTAGSVAFIGLVVPHFIRLLAGSDHRVLLPAAALAGGSLLVLADLMARTLMAPYQLPVGVLTAAIGVPLFLYLLHRGGRLS